jgi:hypothetical protein
MRNASSAPGTSPTPEFLRHGPVEPPQVDGTAFRPYWRRGDRLERLCRTGVITPAELRAATAFRALWERAHRGDTHAMQWGGVTLDRHCWGRRPEPGERQLGALHRLRVIRHQLGALFILLEMAVVAEASWCEIGHRLGIDPKTARTWSCAAIAGLAAL